MTQNVRVRFAPSPTGPLHIGGLRTALFNYLFAKKHNGTFVLRIEDTDQKRYTPGAEKYIIEALNWSGIPFDEGPKTNEIYGPYRQSERQNIYKKQVEKLINSGHAYYAFDTPESLDTQRKKYETQGKTFIYNWHNRLKLDNALTLSHTEIKTRLEAGTPYVIRFKTPENQTLKLHDSIRGTIQIDSNTLDDKVLIKNDGLPTYHLANVVDDHLMKISHVIRGEEWLPSLALHHLLYKSLDWSPPIFAHLPLILKPVGKGKLSKRDGDKLGFPVFPLSWEDPETKTESKGYREAGYFPEAVINFLALLGWNPGTEAEIFSLKDLIKNFDLGRVNKSGARFDPEKITWFNHHYMSEKSNTYLAKQFQKTHEKLTHKDTEYITSVVGLVKERANFVSDFWSLSHYFFEAPTDYDSKAFKKAIKPQTKDILEQLNLQIDHINIAEFNREELQKNIKNWITNQQIGFGTVMMPLRVALVGALQGPDVFAIMELIGKDDVQQRIKTLRAMILKLETPKQS